MSVDFGSVWLRSVKCVGSGNLAPFVESFRLPSRLQANVNHVCVREHKIRRDVQRLVAICFRLCILVREVVHLSTVGQEVRAHWVDLKRFMHLLLGLVDTAGDRQQSRVPLMSRAVSWL